jgi:hypothetical protein
MPKRKIKATKNRSSHDGYDLPANLDFSKMRLIGIGVDALERHASAQEVTVRLDSDVARVFSTSESVNTVLRGIIKSLAAASRRKKSA